MSRFWNIFRDLAYFRISWKIQNDMIGAVNEYKKSSKSQSIQNNIENIKDKVYNNNFNKNRIKK